LNFENEIFFLGVWGFISSPHFFQSDRKFRENAHGMQPDANKHEFIMSFDPVRIEFNKINFILFRKFL
jgi:hypothetical protein